ncbi:MAG: hydroxyacid dehydrogenase [Dehalococcoidia bacterium]|nr:hydroxyacid dehydrogenase [Dehalococcoidia bacterium]
MPSVLVVEPIHDHGLALLGEAGTLVVAPDPSRETVQPLLGDAAVVVLRATQLTAEMIDAAAHLRVIGRHGVGYDNVDVAMATARGIPVVYTPEANSESVAEHAFGLMIALSKTIVSGDRLLQRGGYASRHKLRGFELVGRVLGVVGCGRIGARLAQMARAAFDMRIVGFDPYLDGPRAATLGIELVSDLKTLLHQADVVSIHTPLTAATTGLIGADELVAMKGSAYLINTSRGGVVDELALAAAIRDGQLAGAGLDVLAEEPPPADHPLLALDNVIVTPHVATHTEEALRRTSEHVAAGVLAVLRGERPQWCVNPEVFDS